MTAEEIRAGLDECWQMPPGRVRTERLERLAEAAKAAPDRALEAEVLNFLARCLEYSAEHRRLPVVMGRMLKLLDEHPAEIADFEHQILWRLKWVTSTLVHEPTVPVSVCVRWMDDLESRYRQRGISVRPVLDLRARLARVTGDLPSALALLEASRAAPRDEMSDCEACENNGQGATHWEAAEEAERALEAWAPVLDGALGCAEEPHRVLSKALVPLLVAGRAEEARSAHLKGYPLVRRQESLRVPVARHIEFCALTGNEARGLEILNEHLDWLPYGGEDAIVRLGFLKGVIVLLRRLGELGHDVLPVGSGTVASARAEAERDLAELTARYDARHGNTATSTRIAAGLARRPLLSHLPLGARTRLPSQSPGGSGEGPSPRIPAPLGVPAVPGARQGYAELLEEARRLTATRHPRQVRAWERLAESAAPTEEIRLEVEVNRAKALVEDDPEEARRVLERLLPELESPAVALDVRAAVATALLRADDAEAAGKAAERVVELAEEARERLTPAEYLAARRVISFMAVAAVATADGSDAASVEAARRTVLAELELAAGLGIDDRVGQQHEALGRIALVCGDLEEARERLEEAVAHYLKAGMPWLAYRPYEILAQLALHAEDGQSGQAEQYARQAVQEAHAHGDEALARASSLLVETLIGQPDRHMGVATAAMEAAYRWEGLSEPDFLHNVFIAARAYRVQGRPAEAVSLFEQVIDRVDVPYDAEGVFRTRENYGGCLSETGEEGRAAEQFLLGVELAAAELVPGDPEWRWPLAGMAWSAAAALEGDRRLAEAVAAYRRTAALWAELGETDNRVRCLRQAAWLDFHLDESADSRAPSSPGPAAMHAVLAELEELAGAGPSEELTTLIEGTREQLAAMLAED